MSTFTKCFEAGNAEIQHVMKGSPSYSETPNTHLINLQMFKVRLDKACRHLCGVATILIGEGVILF